MLRDLVVETVSPVMVGGARNDCDDPPTLRPPSVRGLLRFWARAIAGPELERRLWGDVESGQRVRLLGAQRLKDPQPAYLFPHKREAWRTKTRMVPPGERVLLRFAIPDPELLAPLQANLWLWLHLGAVGRRSRRGYGSLLWEPHPGHLLDGFLDEPFDRWTELESPERLEGYLRRGLETVFRTLGLSPQSRRSSQPGKDFVLSSLDQVFVAHKILAERDFRWHVAHASPGRPGPERDEQDRSLECLLHGLDPDRRGSHPHSLQLGRGKSSPPSPMIWRLFPVPNGHVVVMTWSPIGYSGLPEIDQEEASGLSRYLTEGLKLGSSLTGHPLLAGPP